MKVGDHKHGVVETKVLTFLGRSLDYLVLALIVALLVVIIMQLYALFRFDLLQTEVHQTIDHALFILILLELFIILFFYLRDHHIRVERVVELGIISIVREILFKVLDMEVTRMLALAGILLVLGALFFVEKFFSKSRSHAHV